MDRITEALRAALEGMMEGHKVRLPDGGQDLFNGFLQLSRARSFNGAHPNPITWEALAAWAQMMRWPLEPHHAEIIMALDETFLSVTSRKITGQQGGVPVVSPSKGNLTPEAFDALFEN